MSAQRPPLRGGERSSRSRTTYEKHIRLFSASASMRMQGPSLLSTNREIFRCGRLQLLMPAHMAQASSAIAGDGGEDP